MSTIEHECRQGRWCKARHRAEDGAFVGRGVERAGTLCRACEDSAFGDIRRLFDDYGQLDAARAEDRTAVAGVKVSGSSTPSIPIPLAVDTLMDDIDTEAYRWAVIVTRSDDMPAHPYRRVRQCMTALCANLGTLVDLPTQRVAAMFAHPDGGDWIGALELDGVDAVLRLSKLHHRALTVLGVGETTTFLRDPCPHCGRKALAPTKDQQYVTCKGCGIAWDSEHFAHLYNVLDFERKVAKV